MAREPLDHSDGMAPSTVYVMCTDANAAAPDGPPPAPAHPAPRRFAGRLTHAYESFISMVSADGPLLPGHPAARTFGNPGIMVVSEIGTGLEDRTEQTEQDDDPVTAAVLRYIAAHYAARAEEISHHRWLGLQVGPGETPRAAAVARGTMAGRWDELQAVGVRLHEGGAGRAGGVRAPEP